GDRRPAAEAPGQDGRPAGAPAAVPQLDAAAVRRAWPEVLAAAKERKKRTAALLVSATVRAVEGDTLVLSIGTPPLARLLSEQSNTDVIAESLHAVLGVRWRIRCEHGDGAPAPTSAEPPRGPARDQPGARPGRPTDRPEQPAQRRPSRPPPTRRSAAPDDGVPLPPEPPDEEAPPDDEEAMLAEAAADTAAPAQRRDPEEAAIELLSAQLGARAFDQDRA
ncbi:MAG TPA: DNA polymerase III subunit gamma/tau, partial [Pseudonocardia sp.]|nr:DNA polymerase III subunit gamma/tau [Pseudonocardia sp.]